LLGFKHSQESIALISEALKGDNHPLFNKNHSNETKVKMSIAKGTTIYVYPTDKFKLENKFTSARKAAEFFNVDKDTVIRYTKSGKLFQDKWFLSISSIDTQK